MEQAVNFLPQFDSHVLHRQAQSPTDSPTLMRSSASTALRQPQPSESEYAAAVARVIAKSRLTANQTPYDPQTLAAAAMAWAEVLRGVVPLDGLQEAYLEALRTRDLNYPLRADEIAKSWREIAARKAGEIQREKTAQILSNLSDEYCCENCKDTGWAYDAEKRGVRRCVCKKG